MGASEEESVICRNSERGEPTGCEESIWADDVAQSHSDEDGSRGEHLLGVASDVSSDQR